MQKNELREEINKVIAGKCDDPFSILGIHTTPDGMEIRAFIPEATQVHVLHKETGKKLITLEKIDDKGFL